MKKIAICGGHLTPALALIEKLEVEKGIEIIFFGRMYTAEGTKNQSAEYKIISGKNIKFVALTAGRLQRKFTRHSFGAIAKIPVGFFQSLYFLLTNRPTVVVSFGGYVSLPVVFSAWLLGIKSVTHEQSTVPGLANRINALFCDRVLLAWPKSQDYFKGKKTEVIGNLIRSDVYKTAGATKKINDFISKTSNLIFVTGGNQGSHFINKLILASLPKLFNYHVVHQVGTVNYKGDFEKASEIAADNYLPVDYLTNADFGAVLNKATIVISRSGANTVWELATLAKPAILIPLPISAANEQLENAKILEEAGVAIIINQSAAEPKALLDKINLIEKDYQNYKNHAREFSKKIPQNAAQKLTGIVLGYT
jgi:UDP-N-acetylglucosamine--N-acetylmuramyl-(pentapeptide) pyrophosphoryl-undecaprenol N-acetylglucosamine transferase